MMASISVIIPVYNGEQYIRKTLESIFAQTYQDYEIVCVDDGSKDASLAILNEYQDKIIVVQQAIQVKQGHETRVPKQEGENT